MPQSPRRLKKQVRDAVGEQVRDLPITAVRLAMFGMGRALLLTDRVTRDVKEIRESGVRPVLDRLRDDVQHATGKVVGRVVERVSGGEEPEPTPRPAAARPEPTARPAGSAPRPAGRVNTSLAASPEITVGKPAPNGQGAKPAPSPRPAPAPEPSAEPAPAGESAKAAEAKPAEPKAPAPKAPAPKAAEPKAPAPKAAEPKASAPAKTTTPAKTTAPAKAAAPKAASAKPAAKAPAKPAPAAKPAAGPTAASLPVPNYDEASVPALRARLRGLSADQVKKLRDYEKANAARAEVLRMFDNRIAKLREQQP